MLLREGEGGVIQKVKKSWLSKMQALDLISRINKDLFGRVPNEKVCRQRAGEVKISHGTGKHTQITGMLEAVMVCSYDEVAHFP